MSIFSYESNAIINAIIAKFNNTKEHFLEVILKILKQLSHLLFYSEEKICWGGNYGKSSTLQTKTIKRNILLKL